MARSRRGRSEGSVYQRESVGRWTATLSLGYQAGGRRKRKVVYGATKQAVLEKLAKLRAESSLVGNLPDAGNLTVAQLLDQWLAATKSKTAAGTYEGRESLVRVHIRPRIGGLKLTKLNTLHVESLYTEMARDGVKPWAARSTGVLLNIVLNYAARIKLISNNPAANVEKPRTTRRDMLFLTDPQAKALLTEARSSNIFALVAAALGSGCRSGELLELQWGDLDLGKGTLTVRRSLTRTKAGFALKEPKTAASRRTVVLPTFAVAALIDHKAAAMKAGVLAGPVFCTRTGGHLDKKNVLRTFRGVVGKANKNIGGEGEEEAAIPAKLRFHDLRHTVASLLLSQGQSLRAVAQRLGHANPVMTLRTSAHCMPTDDAKLAEGLNAMLG